MDGSMYRYHLFKAYKMIKVTIIEDEPYAARHLEQMLKKLAADVEVIGVVENIEEGLELLPSQDPDLVIADIHLEDGLSFEIFEKLKWKKPILFVTAYDAYAIRAFKVNGIDYLLKPCDEEELLMALERYRSQRHLAVGENLQHILSTLLQPARHYKERFAVQIGSRVFSILQSEIAYFTYSNRTAFLVKTDGQKLPYSESLDQLVAMVNPVEFFRLNRNYLVRHAAIERIENLAGRVMLASLNPPAPEGSVSISKDRITEFKAWLDS